MRRLRLRRETLREDAAAGLVLGVQSVPDGLATGLLAGVNPALGAVRLSRGHDRRRDGRVVGVHGRAGDGSDGDGDRRRPRGARADDGARALFTLSILTGIVMLAAGLLRLGTVLRFVSNAVMVGFINAVGVNIVLGQLPNLTGYAAEGVESRRPGGEHAALAGAAALGEPRSRPRDDRADPPARADTGRRPRVSSSRSSSPPGPLPRSAGSDVATLDDLGVAVDGLPTPVWPSLADVPALIVPALSLTFVALVQGAGISANFVNPDGTYPDASRDFVGQGAANVAAGLLQGMPVGGSLSASALNKAAGARSRQAPLIAGPRDGRRDRRVRRRDRRMSRCRRSPGLLILIGVRTIKPADLVVGVAHRHRPEGGARRHLRADDGDPAAVRRPRRRRPLGRALRRPAVERRHGPALGLRRGGARDRGRPAGRAPTGRGRRAPALRQPLLRRGTRLRGGAARRRGAIASTAS